ncbi:hypothetical protein AMELA_G00242260 [Ameiurus melas]|uniref:MHC class I-like antigen recognition-like domain-containing protein n=1 Tax=Ameiurus melas TaxID=219545 RepID=A0A7J5ZW38_AMEME|nr:hypothetical protein AMELA_G00242260 [Ameiurus melas]
MKDNTAMLKLLLFLSFSPLSSADTHTLQYLYTAVTPGVNFTAVGLVDGEQFVFYNINMMRISEWMKAEADDPLYRQKEEQYVKDQQDSLQNILSTFLLQCQCSRNTFVSRGVVSCYRFLPQNSDDHLGEGQRTCMRTWISETLPNQDGTFQKEAF